MKQQKQQQDSHDNNNHDCTMFTFCIHTPASM